MRLLFSAQVRELDRQAIKEVGIPGPVLMETAGRAVAEAVVAKFPSCRPGVVIVLSGKGNNGGDGYVIARTLRDRGWQVHTLVLAQAKEIRGDAAIHLRVLKRSGGRVVHVSDPRKLSRELERHDDVGLVVDALLGTGLSSEVQGVYRQAILWCNKQPAPVVAVDIPSGVDADSGSIHGVAVRAALSVTFAAAKPGLVSYPGAACTGELVVADIGIPSKLVLGTGAEGRFVDADLAASLLPSRPADGHKGSFGHLLVLAGSRGKSGAALLATSGGLRSGTGLVTLATPASLLNALMTRLTEAMSLSVPDSEGAVSSLAYETVSAALSGMGALALGPGLGASETTSLLVQRLVAGCDKPLVVDADGLNALCGHLDILKRRRGAMPILTPHPGEMSRLTGVSVAELERGRLKVARDFARDYRVVVVLKGARTVIAAPDGRYSVNGSGNPGLASGGMGDVLTGLIGGLYAQGLEAYDAATLGCYLHGAAADRLALRQGDAGLLAGEVAEELPAARQSLTNKGDDS
ncbi:MAG: bifunctional ADP-dependent NAD(P)H-hydrate dehydratase/NAD(P)H-hydrate epimerase [Desulfuromonas sp.]|nr:MAG: bifunctional ADP-dependent NAD(P)H-hydrate dehydratase/NAD(P)H-hydrate epimerase [Desulfuromonas sp.]